MYTRVLRLLFIVLSLFYCVIADIACVTKHSLTQTNINPNTRTRAMNLLRQSLHEQQRWVKVHAAEFLLLNDLFIDEVRKTFEQELATQYADPQYRVGIYRVLAQTTGNEQERLQWINKILPLFLDTKSPARVHAAETLGKLSYAAHDDNFKQALLEAINGQDKVLAVYSAWVLANSGSSQPLDFLCNNLYSEESYIRSCAAFALRHIPMVSSQNRDRIVQAAQNEPLRSSNRVYMVTAAFSHSNNKQREKYKQELTEYLANGTKAEKYEVCLTLTSLDVRDNICALVRLLNDPDADVRNAAAYVILSIDKEKAVK